MRILYVINHQPHLLDGVNKKINDQVASWESFGHTVQVAVFCKKDSVINGSSVISRSTLFERGWKTVFNRNKRFEAFVESFAPDISYVRYHVFSNSVRNLFNHHRCMVEINNLPILEARRSFTIKPSFRGVARFFGALLTERFIRRSNAEIVTVSEDLSKKLREKMVKKNIYLVPNAIDLSRYTNFTYTPKSSKPQLTFIGTAGHSPHGVDYLEQIAKYLPDAEFNIVGYNGESSGNIKYYGFLEKDDLEELLQFNTSVCVGSLAMFRVGLSDGSNLKTREYAARGFPIIMGHRDCGFYSDIPKWVLEIDVLLNTPQENAEKIKSFLSKNFRQEDIRQEAIIFDVSELEPKRLLLFREAIKTQ